jgi:hypothetical protein
MPFIRPRLWYQPESREEFTQFHERNFARIPLFIIGSELFHKKVQITCCFPLSVDVFQLIHIWCSIVYIVVHLVCKHSFPEIHEVACNKLTDIDC